MTLPNLPFGSTTQADLAQGVVMPSGLGSAWQDQSKAKYLSLASGRFPAPVRGTSAGSPAVSAGPLGFVVDLVAQFMSTVGNADPASIKRPEDLYGLVEDFVSDLPLVGELIDLKDAMLGEYAGDDPIFLFIQDLFAPLRKLLQLASGQSGIPTVGELTSGWSSLWDDIQADFGELLAALRGEYAGGDPILAGIQSWAGGLGGLVGGLLGGIPDLWPVGSATDEIVNQLANPSFEGAVSVDDADGLWFWDEVMGRTAPGSVWTDADGSERALLSERHEVREGQKVRAGGYACWDGVAAGAGEAFAVRIAAFDDAETLVSTTTVGAVSAPATSSAGSWVAMQGDWTVPAGVRWVRVQIVVTAAVAAGRVRFDDMLLAQVGRMPQRMVDGLTEALTALADWVEHLVDQLLAALGVPPLGSLFDKITDLSDEIDTWRGDTEARAGQLADLIGDLLSDPASVLGTLPQTLISNASGWVTTSLAGKATTAAVNAVNDFLLDLANAILSAIRGVPVVGGVIADRIEDVLDDITALKSTADTAQSTADAVQVGIVEGWAGGSSTGADPDVFDTMGAIRALVGGDGYTRVNITSTTTWTKPAGTTEVIVVGIAAGQNGGNGSGGTSSMGGNGGNGAVGGGHKVQALDPSAFSSLGIIVGSGGGSPTQIRANGTSGTILMEAIPGGGGAMATQFGYTGSNSQAGGGGGGGGGSGSDGQRGTPGAGTGGGQPGTNSAQSYNSGGAGGASAAAVGGAANSGAGGGVSPSAIPCGGGGGGGGRSGSQQIGQDANGSDGGPGGFPGGGGGGGGGGARGTFFGGSGGSGGSGGAGLAIIFYR